MTSLFEDLLAQLSQFLRIPLHVDQNNACLLQIRGEIQIQLQLDVSQENMWMASLPIEIPPGKFRENVLKEALKTNNLPDPVAAIISYLPLTNRLALHQIFPLNILNGERLAAYFGSFLEQVESWILAIQQGRPAPIIISSEDRPPTPFGIKL
jgi:hypothetical protein